MNEFFSTLFGKSIDAITEIFLYDYFSIDRQESNTIEYKSYDCRDLAKDSEKIGKIVRSVAAMLNSGGGIIIWGAPRPNKDPTTQEHIVSGCLTPVNLTVGKDRFMSIVVSNISPSPRGIRFEPVQLAAGGFVYLIEVPGSEYPPHQYDGRYYARFDSLSKAAPHHFVEALMKQVKQPTVQGFIEFGGSQESGRYVVIPAIVTLFNLSRHIPATNLSYEIIVDPNTVYVDDEINKTEIGDKKIVLKASQRRTLLNNKPVYRKFLIYAPIKHSGRNEFLYKIDLIFWADNVPLCFSRYHIKHTISNEVNNILRFEPVYENRPAFEIVAEKGKSEQEVIQELRTKGIHAFEEEFYRTPLGRKLLE